MYFIDKYLRFCKTATKVLLFFHTCKRKEQKSAFFRAQTFSKTGSGSENWVNETFAKPLAKAKQTTAIRRTTAVHRTANREVRVLLSALRFVYQHFRRRFLSFWEALWGIRGIYAEYSWCIHGVFICIGYVSGMYRVCIGNVSNGTGRVRGYGWHRKRRVELTTISTICAQINSPWALLGGWSAHG